MGKRVLIVEDEAAIRNIWTHVFRRLGHETEEATNGTDALKVLESSDFDVLLTDLRMPGMSGVDLITAVERDERFSGLEIFVCSGFAEDQRGQLLARRGVKRVIDKPFRVSEEVKYFRELWSDQ